MESRIDGRVCFASILTLSLIRLDRGTASWRMPTVAANDTPLLTIFHPILIDLIDHLPLTTGDAF